MKYVIVFSCIMIFAFPAFSQEPDALEEDYGKQHFSAEVARDNALTSLGRLIEDRRKLKNQLAAERAWWAAYLKGLEEK